MARRIKKDSKRVKKQKAIPLSPDEILGQAVLVDLTISSWAGRVKDKRVTQEVHDSHGASENVGNFWKRLFGRKVPEIAAITTAVNFLTNGHRAHTLPWSDQGRRMLPTANHFAHAEMVREGGAMLRKAVDGLVTALERLKKAEKIRMNGLYNEDDYPSAEELRSKYAVRVDYYPIPAAGDFRVDLPKEHLQEMAEQLVERRMEGVRDAIVELWQRFGDAVTHFRDRLKKGEYLHPTTVTRLRDMVDVLGRLNVTGDVQLSELRQEVLRQLTAHDVETLKDDDQVRKATVKQADAILRKMQDFYTPQKKGGK